MGFVLSSPCAHFCLQESLLFLFIFQNFNADYQLTAKQGADTLAFVALVHSKLYPAVVCLFRYLDN